MKLGAGSGIHVAAVAGSNPAQYQVVDARGTAPAKGMTELELRAVLVGGGLRDDEIDDVLTQARQHPR